MPRKLQPKMDRSTCEHFVPAGIPCKKCKAKYRQEKLKAKRDAKGLLRFEIYATPEQRDLIVEYLAGRAEIVKLSKGARIQTIS